MPPAHQQLETRAQRLTEQGADPLRLEVLECARQFKRSWVRMAEVLLRVRQRRAYEAWGYKDLYAYCAEELLIKRATVDKLTASYGALERHAPAVLQADGVEQPVPSLDAVGYFAKAVDDSDGGSGSAARPPSRKAKDVIDELRRAVFDELKPVGALRREFNPVLFAKSDAQQTRTVLERARSEVRRLIHLLPELEGLSSRRLSQVESALQALEHDLERLIAQQGDAQSD